MAKKSGERILTGIGKEWRFEYGREIESFVAAPIYAYTKEV